MINRLKMAAFLAGLALAGVVTFGPATTFAQTSPNSGRITRINHLKQQVQKMDKADDRLMALANKLQKRINSLTSRGRSVGSLQSLLNDMRSKLSDADTQYKGVEGLLDKIQPSDSNFKSEITQVKLDVKTGAADLKAARIDAKKIKQGLKTNT